MTLSAEEKKQIIDAIIELANLQADMIKFIRFHAMNTGRYSSLGEYPQRDKMVSFEEGYVKIMNDMQRLQGLPVVEMRDRYPQG